MSPIFIAIYRFFQNHKGILYSSMLLLFAVMGYFSLKINYQEDITKFIPNSADSQRINAVFQNLKVKDKLIVLVSSETGDKESLIETGDALATQIDSAIGATHINQITSKIDGEKMLAVTDFIYDNLPIFLDSADYQKLDSATKLSALKAKMQQNYETLASPVGLFAKNFIFKDPLGIGNKALGNLRGMQLSGNYQMEEEHLFTQDGKSMMIFIEPRFPAGNTTENAKLVDAIEQCLQHTTLEKPHISVEYFGGPAVAVYNSRQIKSDTVITLGIALCLISVVIFLSFRNKLSLLHIMLPVVFGGLFALSILYFIKGEISIIAIGAGSAIFGVVLSYSIHVVAHREHTRNSEEIIKEMIAPLTIGSFTTIGAFFSLIFTNSEVLQDFGWFASLTIIGTTIFCLIFLPHLLVGDGNIQSNGFLRVVEKLNAYHYEKNKLLVIGILLLTAVGLYFSNDVKFNADMNSLSFQPKHLRATEIKLDETFQKDYKNIYFIATGENEDEALQSYWTMNQKIDSLKKSGAIAEYATGESLLVPTEIQKERIEQWNNFWDKKRKDELKQNIHTACSETPFTNDSFEEFWTLLDKSYTAINYGSDAKDAKIYSDWITKEADITMAISQIRLKEEDKTAVYSQFQGDGDIVILDKPYFASRFVNTIKDDFYFVLFVSSFIVFISLFISYGRLELALLSFTPMALSWFIILGLMAIFGIEFNIVNIIISTFIFGIGDDFSIFISDGLLYEYRTGKKMFSTHKTAIFYSAFTTIVGMGALAFAQHPALQSVSFTSLFGMFAVLLIAYSIQPLIFDFFVTSRTKKGQAPWTIFSLAHFLFIFGCFTLLTLLLTLYASVLHLIPINKEKKRLHIHKLITYSIRYILFISRSLVREVWKDLDESQFDKPSMIISNHQSMIDILQILALSPKIIMITKDWVWDSPIMGGLVRMAGFYNISEGYEDPKNELPDLINKGYSIAIFPEGIRSENDELKRFHKGAFYLAEKLNLDILPIIMTGNGQCLRKSDFMLNRGLVTLKMLPRIPADDSQWGSTYQERQKSISRYFKQEYEKEMADNRDVIKNPYYYHRLTRNFIFKGPVTEWYMRIKVKLEHNYHLYDELIPKEARITDIGCGYGFLPYILSWTGRKRQVTGIDYDEEKIEVANNCFSKDERINFVAMDALSAEIPSSDVFIMNDMLHYMPYEKQERLIEKCMSQLSEEGFIIIRDGNKGEQKKHEMTKMTEVCSTQIFKFNKTEGELHFSSKEQIKAIAEKNGYSFKTLGGSHYTSNTIYILKKEQTTNK